MFDILRRQSVKRDDEVNTNGPMPDGSNYRTHTNLGWKIIKRGYWFGHFKNISM